MMRYRDSIWALGVCVLAIGCGTSEVPQQQVVRTQAAVRAAEEVGAEGVPDAALSLKFAQDQLQQAQHFADAGDVEQAAAALRRAELDAELAIAITERQNALRRANQARERVETLGNGEADPMGNGNDDLDMPPANGADGEPGGMQGQDYDDPGSSL